MGLTFGEVNMEKEEVSRKVLGLFTESAYLVLGRVRCGFYGICSVKN